MNEKWNYKMFNDPNLKYSCVINSSNGDSICKMLRDDAPNNAIQESRAKLIISVPQMLDELKTNHDFLLALYSTISNSTFDKDKAQQLLRDRMAQQLQIIDKATK